MNIFPQPCSGCFHTHSCFSADYDTNRNLFVPVFYDR